MTQKLQPAGYYSYASNQETTCAGCGLFKHTPLRVDQIGGYVCFTCIDKQLESLLEANQPAGPELQFMSSDELRPRTPSEKKAYLEGVVDGKMYAIRDGLTAATGQGKRQPLTEDQVEIFWTKLMCGHGSGEIMDFVRDIEAAHGITATPKGKI